LGYCELLAWDLNIRSIIMGKLNNEDAASVYAKQSVIVAEEIGDFWLSVSVRLRMLHRADWNQWEAGKRPDDAIFEDLLANNAKG